MIFGYWLKYNVMGFTLGNSVSGSGTADWKNNTSACSAAGSIVIWLLHWSMPQFPALLLYLQGCSNPDDSSSQSCDLQGPVYKTDTSLTLTQRYFWHCGWHACSSCGLGSSPRRFWAAGASQCFFLRITESVSRLRCFGDCQFIQHCDCS